MFAVYHGVLTEMSESRFAQIAARHDERNVASPIRRVSRDAAEQMLRDGAPREEQREGRKALPTPAIGGTNDRS